MSGRRLVLVRHGRTAWNAEQRGQGHADVPLDQVGVAQAAAVAPALAGLEPAGLWCSDLSRARETARAVQARCGLVPTVDHRLREFDLGERTGLTLAEFEQKMPEEHAAFLLGDIGAVPGAESTEQVADRVGAALRDAWEALAPGECGIVVSHGAALRVGVVTLLGLPLSTVGSFEGLANCGWAVLCDAGAGAGFRLAAYNRTAPVADAVADAVADRSV